MELTEECARVKILERRPAVFHCLQRRDAICCRQPIEILAIGLARPGVGCDNPGRKKFARRQRELVTLLGLSLVKRT